MARLVLIVGLLALAVGTFAQEVQPVTVESLQREVIQLRIAVRSLEKKVADLEAKVGALEGVGDEKAVADPVAAAQADVKAAAADLATRQRLAAEEERLRRIQAAAEELRLRRALRTSVSLPAYEPVSLQRALPMLCEQAGIPYDAGASGLAVTPHARSYVRTPVKGMALADALVEVLQPFGLRPRLVNGKIVVEAEVR